MSITPLPDPPSRSDPATFADKADNLLGALPTFVTEANAFADTVNVNAAAILASEAPKWVSATAYVEGDVVWSPSDYKAYRAKGATSGTTDPADDQPNWALIAGLGDVTVDGTQTLSNKSFDAVTVQGAITETVFALTDAETVDIDPDNGTIQTWTLGASRNATVTMDNGQYAVVLITAGAHAVTWTGVTWSSGVAPTLSSTLATAVLLFRAGGVTRGTRIGDF